MFGTLELGVLYAILALGVYLTFRILNFPDLTVDGSFTAGAATAAALMVNGDVPPIIATACGAGVGCLAGLVTGLLYTKGQVDGLLAGILTMIALWSINLHIMGSSNIGLLGVDTVFTPFRELGWVGTTPFVALILLAFVLLLKFALDWFLSTDIGLAIQATGNNEQMIRSFQVNTHTTTIVGLMLANGLVGLSGALLAQQQGFADISMGVGMILVGLASVIIGQAIIRGRSVLWATFAVILGAILYRLIIFGALQVGLDSNDMKLVSALLVVAALLLPRLGILKRLSLPFNKAPAPKRA